jgi:hypothetical protein
MKQEMHTKFWSENMKGRDHSAVRIRWEDNGRIELRETGWKNVVWMRLVQDRDR